MVEDLLNINLDKLSKTQIEELILVLSKKSGDRSHSLESIHTDLVEFKSTLKTLNSTITTLNVSLQSLQEKYDKQEILLKSKNASIRNLQQLLYGSKSEKQKKEPTTDGVQELTLFETDEVTQERLDFLEAQQKKEDEQKASVTTQRVKKKGSLEIS